LTKGRIAVSSCHPRWRKHSSFAGTLARGGGIALSVRTLQWVGTCPPQKCPFLVGIWSLSGTWFLHELAP